VLNMSLSFLTPNHIESFLTRCGVMAEFCALSGDACILFNLSVMILVKLLFFGGMLV